MARPAKNNGITEITLKDGSKSFLARVHRAGFKEESKRFKTYSEALRWKREQDAGIDRGHQPLKAKNVLIPQIISDYIAHRIAMQKPIPDNQVTEYEKVALDWAKKSITALTPELIQKWLHLLMNVSRGTFNNGKEKKPYAEASARKFYYALKVAAEWHARQHKYHLDEYLFNPPKGSIPSGTEGARERRLAADEETRLYANAWPRKNSYTEQDWRNIIGFALETAMRLQEIVKARWVDLLQDDYKLKAPKAHTKTKRTRIVLLSRRAREIVALQRASCPDKAKRIFHQVPSEASLGAAFARLTERAKIRDLHFHDLRHEGTTRLCLKGQLNQMQLMEMTDHSTLASFKIYLHLLEANDIRLDPDPEPAEGAAQ